MHVLVTGGAGYIGSHTVIELLTDGHEVTVIDNLSNSSLEAVKRVEKICGKSVAFFENDLCDKPAIERIFSENTFDAVLHFAGLKAVGESVAQPLNYYHVNLMSTLNLCEVMKDHNVKKLVFSSSATVYGEPSELPLRESSRVGMGITNPYGRTKYMIEQILHDIVTADPTWQITILRYFNPIGAHPSGLIGEDPSGMPNNLLPYIAQVAVGKREAVQVFGDDYDTPDGTGLRDYIHVVDLAQGHVAAVNKMTSGLNTYNLGTGNGHSVMEMISAFEKAAGKKIPFVVVNRRAGDIASCYADCAKAKQELDWKVSLSVHNACEDAWRWQSQNPNGYRKERGTELNTL